jgi:hypothetical protein|tara:strand:+ start:352 stop:540 length:189 start_codon:yes stop_codon:yes gene_type:complete
VDNIRITVNKEEYNLLIEAIDVFGKICANEQKKEDIKELLKDLKDVKKQYAITETTEPGICD